MLLIRTRPTIHGWPCFSHSFPRSAWERHALPHSSFGVRYQRFKRPFPSVETDVCTCFQTLRVSLHSSRRVPIDGGIADGWSSFPSTLHVPMLCVGTTLPLLEFHCNLRKDTMTLAFPSEGRPVRPISSCSPSLRVSGIVSTCP
jgi:hypothetical protein